MGDRACYRAFCPSCDLQVTVIDETCPECGSELPRERQRRQWGPPNPAC